MLKVLSHGTINAHTQIPAPITTALENAGVPVVSAGAELSVVRTEVVSAVRTKGTVFFIVCT